jgi:hypothetical protein
MTEFIPGLKLAERFYWDAVRPILDQEYPSLPHSAALLGSGSEVLGFDTEMSSDHHWGPRVMLFLREAEHDRFAETIRKTLRQQLPYTFLGYPTNFGEPDPEDNNVQHLQIIEVGPVNHRVELLTIRDFVLDQLNFDIDDEITAADWLTFPQQKLLTVTAGAVYHDDALIGLERVRSRFAFYPHDVWLYMLAAGWSQIGEAEHLMPRAGYVGDEPGSAQIGAQLVRTIMQLCFLMERRYAPYSKWFGTAFARLNCAGELVPLLRAVQLAETWQTREQHLVLAYEMLARMHNVLGITEPVPTQTTSFFGRPFKVIMGSGIAERIAAQITDSAVKKIMQQRIIGSIDQITTSTDLLEDISRRYRIKALYET